MNMNNKRNHSKSSFANNKSTIHKRCMDTKLTKCLDLSGLPLYVIPKPVYKLSSVLRHLYLHRCSLKDDFPFDIISSLLISLETLDLSQNNITLIPDSFCMAAKNLKILDVSYNQLYRLPGSLDEMVSLQELNSAHNALIYVPSELGKLTKLKEIDLNSNQILGLPTALFQSNATASLRSINVSRNQLSELPNSLGNVRALKTLKFSENKLRYLPATCKLLVNIQTLHYGGNNWYADSFIADGSKAYGVKALIAINELSM